MCLNVSNSAWLFNVNLLECYYGCSSELILRLLCPVKFQIQRKMLKVANLSYLFACYVTVMFRTW